MSMNISSTFSEFFFFLSIFQSGFHFNSLYIIVTFDTIVKSGISGKRR